MADRTIARWESRSGKHWVALYQWESGGYYYRAPAQGGSFGAPDDDAAVREVQRHVDLGLFQPDANTTPMHRVTEK